MHSVVTSPIRSPRVDTTDDLDQLDLITGELSSALLALGGTELATAVDGALGRLVEALDADVAAVLEYAGPGKPLQVLRGFARPGATTGADDLLDRPSYAARFRAGETIVLNRLPDDVPAGLRNGQAARSSAPKKSRLVLPIAIGGHVTSALDVATVREFRTWTPPVIQRLRLIAEIIAAAIHRDRQDSALMEARAELGRAKGPVGEETRYLRETLDDLGGFHEIVGESAVLRASLAQVIEVAPTDATVLLLGETGTGKELFARALHQRSLRGEHPFISVNCAALPAALIESELFGHERGAFTGAVAQRQGRFELADRGTLLLDEIGDLPLEVQSKLLRVLQEGEFERLGSSNKRRSNVRLIAATNRDLGAMTADGRFRNDLYFRVNVFPIRLPPLRERSSDIPRLVWYLIHRRQKALRRSITTVPSAVMDRLQAYDWPGNVRELQNVIERAMIRSTGDTLALVDTLGDTTRQNLPASSTLDVVQRRYIENVLEKVNWRINGPGNAAEQLGLHPNTLRFRMKKLGIARPS
jgi:transcriptional regulator with GAF, ATPase, and Fis domain